MVDVTRELLDPSARDRYERGFATGTWRRRQRPAYGHLILAFARAGGRLVLGSDSGSCGGGNTIAGVGSHHPLKVLVGFGFSPLEVIRIATIDGATFLGIDDRTGSIQVGKEADLLIVSGNPAEHIDDLDNVEMVFANGIAYDPQALLEILKGEVGRH